MSLAVTDVACVRGGRRLFAAISFALAPGDALVVVGPNGVGKSSLLRIAAGLLRPSAGVVTRTGPAALADEAPALDASLPLAQALAFWAALDGGDVTMALHAVALAHLADVPVRMLSTGQRRRATLARMVASGAPIWLLDEPANGLDAQGITMLEALIVAHRAQGGIAVVATHQPLGMPNAQTLLLG